MMPDMPPEPGTAFPLRPPLSAVPLPTAPRRRRGGISRRDARALRRSARVERKAESTWTAGHKRIAGVLVLAALGIAAVAFWSLFDTTTTVMHPSMGSRAWMVIVAGEIAFTFFFGTSILHALRRAPSGAIRPLVTWLIVAGSVAIQAEASRIPAHPARGHAAAAAAGHGTLVSLVGHELIVVAFYGVLLSAKSTVMILLGGKVRADRITLAEWVAHPVQAGRLWRWRATWGEPSADAARERYMRLLFAEAITQAHPRIGREEGWRDKLPAPLAYQLATGLFPGSVVTAGGDWQDTVRCHVESQLALLPDDTSDDTDGDARDDDQDDSDRDTDDDGDGGKSDDTRDRKQGDTSERSRWPDSRSIPDADLRRMVRTAVSRWERQSPGKRMPDARLEGATKLRMARTTAKNLLAAEYQRRATASR